MNALPHAARAYWAVVTFSALGVITVAVVAAIASLSRLHTATWFSLVVLACLALIGERLAVPLMGFDGEPKTHLHTLGSVAGVAAIIVLPWYLALPLLPLAVAWTQRKRPLVRTIFNASHYVVSIATAAAVFHLAGGDTALHSLGAIRALAVMLALASVYYLSENVLVVTMVALASKQKLRDVYHASHLNTVLQESAAIGLGIMLGGFWLFNPAFTPLVALPVVMAYFSIETFVRIQQETRNAVLEMARSIDLRDPATRLHSQRVAKLSVALAKELGLSQEQIANIELSSLVHDIGKIGIPNEILNKPGKLSAEERGQMEAHPVIGYEMLRHYKQFRKGLGIVRWHHERWDGAGYPDGIPDLQVPLEARIVCIADAFEAMTADRPYRRAMSFDIAFSRLEESAGTQFDPHMVPLFRAAVANAGESAPAPVESSELPSVVSVPDVITVDPPPAGDSVVRPLYPRRVVGMRRVSTSARACRAGTLARQVDRTA